MTYTGGRASHEDQTSQVGSTSVAERAGGVHQSTDAISLQGAAGERGTPGGGGGGGLLGLEEFLLGVGGLGAVVGVAKDRSEDGERGGVVEDGAERNGGGFHWWEVCGAGAVSDCKECPGWRRDASARPFPQQRSLSDKLVRKRQLNRAISTWWVGSHGDLR